MARACDTIASGALGPLVAVVGTALFYKPDRYFDEAPWRTQPGGGPVLINMASAAKCTIAQVREIVELGTLDPEAIVTPGIFVQRVVEGA